MKSTAMNYTRGHVPPHPGDYVLEPDADSSGAEAG